MVRSLVAVVLVACSGAPGGPTMNNKIDDGTTLQPQRDPVESADILAREPVANTAKIKHILIGWNDGTPDDGQRDKRAAKRTKKDAEDQIRALLEQIKNGADFDALMKQYSEDPGSASSGARTSVTRGAARDRVQAARPAPQDRRGRRRAIRVRLSHHEAHRVALLTRTDRTCRPRDRSSRPSRCLA